MDQSHTSQSGTADRRHWLSILAKAPADLLETLWSTVPEPPKWRIIKPAETGMVMVRGRIGGDGARFNLGELTVSKCAVRLGNGQPGLGYVQGRSGRHAELAAVLDAMLQSPEHRDRIQMLLIKPLTRHLDRRRLDRSRKAASTKVEFFTMVRGDNS